MPESHTHVRSKRSPRAWPPLRSKPILIALAMAIFATAGGVAYFFLSRQSPSEHRDQAAKLLKNNDIQGALIEYKNAIQMEPGNGAFRFDLGMLHYARGQMADAEKEFKSTINDLAVPQARIMLARVLLQINQPKRVLDEVFPVDGGNARINAEIHALRAWAQLTLGDTPAYEKSISAADALDPDNPATLGVRALAALRQGQVEPAREHLEKALAKAPLDDELLLLKGGLLTKQRLYPEAIATYVKATQASPHSLRARLALAALYLQGRDLKNSEAELKSARRITPNNLVLRYQEALLAFHKGEHAEALARAQEVTRAAPDYSPARLLAGTAALASGNRESALKDLEYVVSQDPSNQTARKMLAVAKLKLGQGEAAKSILSQLPAALLDDPVLLSAQGEQALRNQDFAEARRVLQRATELKPDQPRLLTELAASQFGVGDETAAIASLERAANLDKTGINSELLLAQTHMRAKRFSAALDVIARIEKKDPKSPVGPNLRGAVAIAQGQNAKAREYFEQATRLRSDYLPAASNLARLDILAKDHTSARNRFEQVIKTDPRSTGAWLALAQLDLLQKDEKAYLAHLGKAKEAAPEHGQARGLLIQYWLTKKDWNRAITEASEAISTTGNPSFHEQLGLAHVLRGDKAEALTIYKKWVDAAPSSPIAHYKLAALLEANGKRADALTYLEKALKLAPDYPDAMLSKVNLLHVEGKSNDALAIARAYQSRFPRTHAGYAAEAILLAKNKKHLEAARMFERAAGISSGLSSMVMMAHAEYVSANQNEPAERVLTGWLKKYPHDARVRHALAQYQLAQGRAREAAGNYEQMIQMNSSDLAALNNLALAYGQLGDARAVPTAERALKLQPESAAVLDTLGWLLVQNNQHQRGITLLRQAVAAQPEAPEIRWHLSKSLAKNGDRNGAIAELDRLLASRISFPEEKEARALMLELRSKK